MPIASTSSAGTNSISFLQEHFTKAADYFQKAIDKDPGYAAAYAGLADANSLLGYFVPFTREAAFAKARAASAHALSLDDRSAEAHLALAIVHWMSWEFSAAEPEYRRAAELNPNFQNAPEAYSNYLVSMGRFNEAMEQARRGLELDPLSLYSNAQESFVLLEQRDYDRAITQAQRTLEIDPNFGLEYGYLAECYEAQGMYDKSMDARKTTDAIRTIGTGDGTQTSLCELRNKRCAPMAHYAGKRPRQARIQAHRRSGELCPYG